MVFQKPIQLFKEHVTEIKNNSEILYAVTLKADGEWVRGSINNDGNYVWLDINGKEIVKTKWSFNLKNILYGEYVEKINTVIIFDMEDNYSTFEERFNVLKKLELENGLRLCDIQFPENEKTFSCLKMFDKHSYPNDGFVFTPRNVVVSNPKDFDKFPIYKWKEINTVDFLIRYKNVYCGISREQFYNLKTESLPVVKGYYNSKDVNTAGTYKTLFDPGSKYFGYIFFHRNFKNSDSLACDCNNDFPCSTCFYYNNKVVECFYELDKGWVPLKIRYDKTKQLKNSASFQGPNNYKIALDAVLHRVNWDDLISS